MDLSKKKRKDAHFFLMNAIQSIILRILVTGRKSKQEILERQWTSIVFHDLKPSFSLLQKPEIVWPTLKQAISHRPFHRMKGYSEGPEMNLITCTFIFYPHFPSRLCTHDATRWGSFSRILFLTSTMTYSPFQVIITTKNPEKTSLSKISSFPLYFLKIQTSKPLCIFLCAKYVIAGDKGAQFLTCPMTYETGNSNWDFHLVPRLETDEGLNLKIVA